MEHITTGKYKDIFNCDHHYPRGNDGRLNRCEFCNREKEISSIESSFDEESYLLVQKADEFYKNPFLKNTNSWYNWNRGKNEKLINNIKCKDNQ